MTTVCFAYRNRATSRDSIRGRCIDANAVLLPDFSIVADNTQEPEPLLLGGPTLVAHDGGFAMAYTARHSTAFPNGAVLVRTLNQNGGPVSAETTLSSSVQPSIAPAIARRSDGRLLALWYDCAGSTGCDILGRYADASGQPLEQIFRTALPAGWLGKWGPLRLAHEEVSLIVHGQINSISVRTGSRR